MAQYASQPLFDAKRGEYQCASIKNRGQNYGKKAIRRWLSNDPDGTKYTCKADVSKCYPSIPHDKLKMYLHRDLRKSHTLLYLYDTIIDLYEEYPNPYSGKGKEYGILVGSPVSKDLCNYYLSYLYHFASEQLFINIKRRGSVKRVHLISHIIVYMDDIVIYGSNKKHVQMAIERIIGFAKDSLGLIIKKSWIKFKSMFKNTSRKLIGVALDFMGFVFHGGKISENNYYGTVIRHRKVWITIRARIFLRSRRKMRRLVFKIKNKIKVSRKLARGVASQFGWYKNTDSYQFRVKNKVDKIMHIANKIVSDYAKGKIYNAEKYYKMQRKYRIA